MNPIPVIVVRGLWRRGLRLNVGNLSSLGPQPRRIQFFTVFTSPPFLFPRPSSQSHAYETGTVTQWWGSPQPWTSARDSTNLAGLFFPFPFLSILQPLVDRIQGWLYASHERLGEPWAWYSPVLYFISSTPKPFFISYPLPLVIILQALLSTSQHYSLIHTSPSFSFPHPYKSSKYSVYPSQMGSNFRDPLWLHSSSSNAPITNRQSFLLIVPAQSQISES